MSSPKKESKFTRGDVFAPRQEAHKMVREANVKQATAEKQLREAQGKVTTASSYKIILFPLPLVESATLTSPSDPP